jgi:hypothetical protein
MDWQAVARKDSAPYLSQTRGHVRDGFANQLVGALSCRASKLGSCAFNARRTRYVFVNRVLGFLVREAEIMSSAILRKFFPGLMALVFAATVTCTPAGAQQPQRPNIVIIWGDDVGQSNVSAYSRGVMGYTTPNIDRLASEGVMFTDYYAEQSCTAGRASFITGQSGLRTGMTKVGLPGATLGLQKEDPTIAELLKPLGYAAGQFGKNHLGDRNEFLPTVHGFDEFYGNLCVPKTSSELMP